VPSRPASIRHEALRPATIRSSAVGARHASRACATRLLEVVPALMREIRSEMRRSAPSALSVPSFRALIFAHTCPGASITELAEHLGVTLPTASVAVDKLAARGLLLTARSAGQRRRSLHLSAEGEQLVRHARQHTVRALAARLHRLPAAQLGALAQGLAELANHVADGHARRESNGSEP
jgi:MarR family transcriptional regulator for hemolysin